MMKPIDDPMDFPIGGRIDTIIALDAYLDSIGQNHADYELYDMAIYIDRTYPHYKKLRDIPADDFSEIINAGRK